jgi:membrane-bound metal-dependent hydrolase YbcI (DUF457 family)
MVTQVWAGLTQAMLLHVGVRTQTSMGLMPCRRWKKSSRKGTALGMGAFQQPLGVRERFFQTRSGTAAWSHSTVW